ncbi:phosphatidylinositol kinase [Alphaproteobacteria bacterium]|nr:phosphatidylinositol kinase [Alphaproteobacteria bacterium]
MLKQNQKKKVPVPQTPQEIHVFIDIDDVQYFVGRLWSLFRNNRESASFEYDRSWLNNSYRFSLEPALELRGGTYHTDSGKSLFGSLGDSAPDRWGRILMRRFENERAKLNGENPRRLNEIDYLLLVNDQLRQGALRFKDSKGCEFLSCSKKSIPLLVDLPKLLAASDKITNNAEISEELQLLLAPGSSLGGARPKASVVDENGNLCMAKFSRSNDEFSVVLWEAVALTLAKKSGIHVFDWRLENGALIVKRFDRIGTQRVPFLSAMSMLGARDNDSMDHSYLEIADALTRYGAFPKRDMRELWRRIVFSIFIMNTDDHLRNHAFLYNIGKGWELSPAYDLNPTFHRTGALSLCISETDNMASIELALSVSHRFQLTHMEAKNIVTEVYAGICEWREIAKNIGIKNREIEQMASVMSA